jgi:hypothetical protein
MRAIKAATVTMLRSRDDNAGRFPEIILNRILSVFGKRR